MPYSNAPFSTTNTTLVGNHAQGWGIDKNKVRIQLTTPQKTVVPNTFVSADVFCPGSGTPGTVTYKGHWHNGSNASTGDTLQMYHITAATTNAQGIADVTLPFSCPDLWTMNVAATPYSNAVFNAGGHAEGWGIDKNKARIAVFDVAGNPTPGVYVSADVFCPGSGTPGTVTYKGHWHNGSNASTGDTLQMYHITAATSNDVGGQYITLPFSCYSNWATNVEGMPYSNAPFTAADYLHAQGEGMDANKVHLYLNQSYGSGGPASAGQWISGEVFCPNATSSTITPTPSTNQCSKDTDCSSGKFCSFFQCAINSTCLPTNPPTGFCAPNAGNNTKIALNAQLSGIGPQGGNTNPLHKDLVFTMELFDLSNTPVSSSSGILSYDTTNQIYKGILDTHANTPTGTYYIKVKTEKYLRKIVPGLNAILVAITAGQTTTTNKAFMVVGDANNDNILDLLDYNILSSCFEKGDGSTPSSCGNKKDYADFNDDGKVNGEDYNLLIRSFATQFGN